jgi:hypothetical protein
MGNQAVKKSRFTEEQIAYALRQAELGMVVADVCLKQGVSDLLQLEEEVRRARAIGIASTEIGLQGTAIRPKAKAILGFLAMIWFDYYPGPAHDSPP